ncbi:MAG: hypothetical protein KDB27_32640 [Planctomycetales bacterium]|nr:hypothetical protein [Planctomycetales bacterium]
MKRLVFGVAVFGLLVVIVPAILRADEWQNSNWIDIAADASVEEVRAAVATIPVATKSTGVQLVDHCYRRGYGYRGYGARTYRSYGPRSYGGYYGPTPRYYAPQPTYRYNDYYYPRSTGFGLYIGF